MKLTRRQLRKLISEAITNINKGPLAQVPYRDPGAEIRSDLNPSQLQKFDAFKDTEPAVRDSLASALGYEGENFGDFEFDFKSKMAGQDPDSKSYKDMYSFLVGEENWANTKAQNAYKRGDIPTGNAYDQLEMFISDELLTQSLAPLLVLETIFNKIAVLHASGASRFVLRLFRDLMKMTAYDAVESDYIVDKEIARKYLGDDPLFDYRKDNPVFRSNRSKENPIDPSRKRRFK